MVARVVKFKSSLSSTGPHRTAQTAPQAGSRLCQSKSGLVPVVFRVPVAALLPIAAWILLPQNISRWRRRRCAIAGHFYWAHCVVCTSHNHLAVGVLVASTKLPYCTNGSIVRTQSLCFCALYWVHICKKPFIMEKHTTLHKHLDRVVVLSFLFHFSVLVLNPHLHRC